MNAGTHRARGPVLAVGDPVDPALLAAIATAALEVWSPAEGAATHGDGVGRAVLDEDAARTWRFSGRWWTRQHPIRASRPWTR